MAKFTLRWHYKVAQCSRDLGKNKKKAFTNTKVQERHALDTWGKKEKKGKKREIKKRH